MIESYRRPPTAQQAVLAELRHRIITGQLRPGQQIVQEALAKELDISRVPLREALKILEGEGLITYHVHRGYYLATLSIDDLREVYRLRELLESEALRVAVPAVGPELIEQLIALQNEIQMAGSQGDVATMAARNRLFHFTLFDASGQRRLVRIIRILWDATDMYRAVYYNESRNRLLVIDEHWDAIEAVKAGDVERVISVMALHRDHTVKRLGTVLEANTVLGADMSARAKGVSE